MGWWRKKKRRVVVVERLKKNADKRKTGRNTQTFCAYTIILQRPEKDKSSGEITSRCLQSLI